MSEQYLHDWRGLAGLPVFKANSAFKVSFSLGLAWGELGNTKLSQPKLNQQLSSTEFEIRLHSYIEIHPPPPQTQLAYSKLGRVDNCPASKKGPSVQVFSHTQTSVETLY